ncbi:sensor histidine kinase [Phytomonospora endophytica]|uniref:histidine kinase n=1 Tax=Phytomonospora endophytica TaxID=714109 RepID=A0A841FM83_9ACTN|nr:sensor histidine kinase [Phytomonospora endophytica]MBB6037115.1 signal transduction histidine kinase [Phytomonospora endophytica]GIG71154.1 two-component sensor histidine kinase [Phytomonospora endophytica]
MVIEEEIRPLFSRRLSRAQLIAVDVGFALLYTLALAGLSSSAEGTDFGYGARLAGAAAIALPLAVRRLWPLPVFGVVLAATIGALAAGLLREPLISSALALYIVAVREPRRRWEPVFAIGVTSALIIVCSSGVGTRDWWAADFGVLVVGAAVLGSAWTVGRAVRERRAYAERTRAQIAGQAAAEERLRIARELHDVVAHSMGVIAVKAGVANHVIESRPQEARDALRVIESASRSAMVELRQMLGVLRHAAEPGEDDPLAPTPGLAGIPGLAERARLAGVGVELDLASPGGLPGGVELAAYRIIQEALTNVVKHAAPTRCRVRLTDDGRALRIEVADEGPGRRVLPPGPGGHGMLGMRERVAVHGGELNAGPLPGGGFRVAATLPYRSEGDT